MVPNKPAMPPSIQVHLSINIDAHRQLSKKPALATQQPNIQMSATADTGAQTCTAGIELLSQLGLHVDDLLKTQHRLRAVDNKNLSVKGAIIADIHVNSITITEMIYVCDCVKGLFLSQTALKKLNLIHQNFPHSPSESLINSTQSDELLKDPIAECGCPIRVPCPPIPEKLPFPATPECRLELERWIKSYFAGSAFNVCPHQSLQAMSGEPLNISFLPDYVPVATHKPIPVPHHWKDAVKRQLDEDVALQIIEPIPTGTPTIWCSRMITVPKKDGTPRRTVDLQNLNAATKRETHHTQSPFNIVSVVPGNTKKTSLDAWNGYHSVPLAPAARDATTFITEWGRYRYLRTPQGFHGSNDGYTKRFDDITKDFPRVRRCVDDSLLWDEDIASAFWHTLHYVKLCGDNGVVFNPEKFHFAKDIVEFAGFDLTMNGYKPNLKLLNAIKDFPSPTNITGIRSWFGLVNQTSYAFAHAPIMSPFRELLKHDGRFYWDETLEQLFQKSKREILNSVHEGVRTFEVNRQTCLTTDWSKNGIGFTLSQKHCLCPLNDPLCGEGHWKITYAGSRFTTETESRYAPIEGEALALYFALDSCKMFIMGCPNLIVAVDHKPLIRIFNNRDLSDIKNPRLLKIKEKTLMFKFRVIAIPGTRNQGADFMSRMHSSQDLQKSTSHIESAVVASVYSQINDAPNMIPMHSIIQSSSTDPIYQELKQTIAGGFPNCKDELPPYLREFWGMRQELYCVDNLIFMEGRMLIPTNLRRYMLDQLHIGHQGVNSMKANARRRFFWPRMGSQIQNRRDQCNRCNEICPSNRKDAPEELSYPTYPFQKVVADLFHMAGHMFIVYADRFSGWTEVASTKPDATASTVISIFRRYFINFGVPEEIATDGGPPFGSSEFISFLKSWNTAHRKSSVGYPQSNGRAEAAVKCMKRILTTNVSQSGSIDTDEIAKALLLHRNTPAPDMGASPAEFLFGRPIKDHLPPPVQFHKQWLELANLREETFHKRHSLAIQHKTCTPLHELQAGDPVAIQNQTGNHPLKWEKTGIISETLPHKQYRVLVDGSRRTTLRNRQFLRKINTSTRNKNLVESAPALILPNGDAHQYQSVGQLMPSDIHDTNNDIAPETSQKELDKPDYLSSPQLYDQTTKEPEPAAVRRSTRSRKSPAHFRDFVMS